MLHFRRNNTFNSKIIMAVIAFWIAYPSLKLTEYYVHHKATPSAIDSFFLFRTIFLKPAIWIILTPILFYINIKINQFFSKKVHIMLLHLFTFSILLLAKAGAEMCICALLNLIPPKTCLSSKFFFTNSLQHISSCALVYIITSTFINLILHIEMLKTKHHQLIKTNEELFQAKMTNLKLQIHPHFVFNTYQGIVGLILKKDYTNAIKMLVKTGALMRLTIKRSEEDFVSIYDELNYISIYLDIHKIRFGSLLNYQYSFSENIRNHPIPAGILQPVIENAVYHGSLKNQKYTNITLNVKDKNGYVEIEIRNTGEIAKTLIYKMGLTNTLSRLSQIYSDKYIFDLRNDSSLTTLCTIALPKMNKYP